MAHTFDLASNWTADTNIMVMQGWHSIPEDEGGSDEDYGVWNPGDPATWSANNPTAYPAHPYAIQDASVCNGGERFIGSQLRPLQGIYSDSGRDAASLANIDRNLQMVRRDGDPRARIDVLACTLGHLAFTSYGGLATGDEGYAKGLDLRYRHFLATLARAEAASLTSCVMPSYEAYYIWLYNSDIYTTKLSRLYAMALDIQGLVTAVNDSTAGFKVDGRPVIMFYRGTLGETITNDEWNTVFEEVRKPYNAGSTPLIDASSPAGTGIDFFVLALAYSATEFNFADGMYSWLNLAGYTDQTTGTVREKASEWVQDSMAPINVKIDTGSFPGRISLGNLSPGFWDWVKGWGNGDQTRYIPRGTATVLGQFDGYEVLDGEGHRPDGMVAVTWNDYAEGSCWEPTTSDNGELLGLLTEQLAAWEGDTADESETEALLALYQNPTQALACPIQYTQGGRQVRKARRSTLNQGQA